MARQTKSQPNQEGNQESDSPLNELLAKSGVTTPEELAALISARSGEKISGSTLRRRFNSGLKGWRKLGLSLVQWDAVAEITGIPLDQLPR